MTLPESIRVGLESGLADCARCGQDHEEPLEWHKFARPIAHEGGEFRYWSTCPTNGDPILFWVKEEPDA